MGMKPIMIAAFLVCIPFCALAQNTGEFTLAQTLSDGAQRTTLAFDGLAMMTGSLEAQSFFPPGKVADYTGFQYLRDNDPDNMGHNTSFLTRIAFNVIYLLNDDQFNQLKTLAVAQLDEIDLYAYKRYPLMKAFRRLLEGDVPAGSAGLSLAAVKQVSRELYLLDGQISFDRALLNSLLAGKMNRFGRAGPPLPVRFALTTDSLNDRSPSNSRPMHRPPASTPSAVAACPCGSRSTSSTRLPSGASHCANRPAKFVATVVLPCPPFLLITVTTLVIASSLCVPSC